MGYKAHAITKRVIEYGSTAFNSLEEAYILHLLRHAGADIYEDKSDNSTFWEIGKGSFVAAINTITKMDDDEFNKHYPYRENKDYGFSDKKKLVSLLWKFYEESPRDDAYVYIEWF